MDLSIKFKADLDQQLLIKKVNIMLAELKKSLGSFGTGISVLDEKSINSQFSKVAAEFGKLENASKKTQANMQGLTNEVEKVGKSGSMLGNAFKFNQITQAVGQITQSFQQVADAGIKYESSLAAVGAITGLSGDKLNVLGDAARSLAKEFGGSATSQLESFQGILSKLGTSFANSPEALALLAKNINILSAASGEDAASSMNALTDSMLQFGLVTGDPLKDAETSTRLINGLAASAQVGAAEIPQVSAAILQAGVAAKGANQSFEQTNAAIQVLAVGGKTGSEAGVALRNVMGLLQNASGPAADALKSMGLSSKELGETLTKKGLNEAMIKIKDGMKKFGSDAERNAALMKIFGMENASAAGILIDNTDKYAEYYDGIIAGEQGRGAAFDQASQRMDTAGAQMEIWKAKIQDTFIGLSQAMGPGLTATLGMANQVQPLITSMSGLGAILPGKQMAEFGQTLLSKLIPGLITTTIVTEGTTAATEGATVATKSFNAAALANPVLISIALFIALVATLKAVRDAYNETAAEKLADANAEKGLIDSQISNTQQRIKSTQDVIKSNDTLITSFKEKGASALNDVDLMTKLTRAYPGVIDATKSYSENLKNLEIASKKSQTELSGMQDELQQLASAKIEVQIKVLKLESKEIQENMESSLKSALVDDAGWMGPLDDVAVTVGEALFGKSDFQKRAEEQMKKYSDAIEKASTEDDIKRAGLALQTAILKGDGEFAKLSANQQKQMADQVQQRVNKEIDVRRAQSTEMQNLTKEQIKLGVSEGEIIDFVTKKYGKTPEEVKKLIAEQQKAISSQKDFTKEIEMSGRSAADLGEAFNTAMATAKKSQSEAVGALSELNKERREGLITEKQYAAAKKVIVQEGIKATREVIKYEKDAKAAKQEILGSEKKAGETAYQIAKKKFDLKKDSIEQDLKEFELNAELSRIQQGRTKTVADDVLLQQKKNEALQNQKKSFEDIFSIITDDKNKVLSVGVKLGENEKTSDVKNDVSKQWNAINNSIKEGEISALGIGAKVKVTPEELKKQLQELNLAQIQFEIEFGIKGEEAMLPVLKSQLKDIQDAIEKETDKSKIVALKKDEISALTEVGNLERKIREKKLSDVQKIHQKELDEIEKKASLEKEIWSAALNVTSNLTQSAAELDKNNRLKSLEAQKEAEIITETQYNLQKEQIELDYQNRIQSTKEAQRGAELEVERQHSIALLKEKEDRLIKERALLNPVADKAQYDALGEQLDEITASIQQKGDLIQEYGTALQGNLTETFTNLFGGDLSGAKDSAKKIFSFMAGIIKQQASLLITQKIIEQLALQGGGLLSFLATPLISALVNVAVGKIIDPILSQISSFATGGRVDEPTLAVVGDASNARRGSNTEWIFRDDQIMMLISMSLARHTKQLEKALTGLMPEILPNKTLNIFDKLSMSLQRVDSSLNKLSDLALMQIGNESMEMYKFQANAKDYDSEDYILEYSARQKRIKSYAGGSGFIYQPELAMVGDAGINNPEVVLNSQNLKDLVQRVGNTNNTELLSTMRNVENLLSQLLNKDSNVYLDGSKVTDEVQREFNRRKYNK
jgi:TP901 family phage tail tape measure protein